MEQKNRTKGILAALIGMLALASSIGIAWFFPGWYGEWQDRKLLDVTVLSSREDISFLDRETLEAEERMRLLKETSQMQWIGYEVSAYEEEVLEEDRELYYRIAKNELQRWKEAGLIPEEYVQMLSLDNYMECISMKVALSQKNLNLGLMILTEDPTETYAFEIENPEAAYDEKLLFLIFEPEKELLYCTGILGTDAEEYMAQLLGYESQGDMIEKLLETDGETVCQQEMDPVYDFASVCCAKNAEITKEAGELNFDVTLEYDNFTGYAQRRIINGEGNFGLSVSLGTPLWTELLMQLFEEEELECTTGEWQEYLLMEACSVEMQE